MNDAFAQEIIERSHLNKRILRFGNEFLDDALLGILPDDLVLVGSPSGIGKTQFCVNLATANIEDEKRVHFFALEAGRFEIERRIKFQAIMNQFFSDPKRPKTSRPIFYDEWEMGTWSSILEPYEEWAQKYCSAAFQNLTVFYKTEKFDAISLIEKASLIKDETDLIIVDHVHYFDWDDDNDNRAIKEIAKAARDLSLVLQKPIVLVAHLRKRDRGSKELCAGLDEFHGSSDLTKIATKVITLAPGGLEDGGAVTYFRTPKNRRGSQATRYLGRMIYDFKLANYRQEYKLGWSNTEKFGEIELGKIPGWVGRSRARRSGSDDLPLHQGQPEATKAPTYDPSIYNGYRND